MRAFLKLRSFLLAACAGFAALLAPGVSRADTVDANATTLLLLQERQRAGGPVTIAPAYELVSISARNLTNPWVDDLQAVFQGWGAVSIGPHLVWFDRTAPVDRVFADFDLAYVQGELLKHRLQIRLGRQLVAGGVVGSLQMDGGNLLLRLPYGLGLTAFAGSPVSQRLDTPRGTETTYNPQRGTLATGGRAYWAFVPWGEVGASVVYLNDHGDPGREQVGADLRVNPWRTITLLGNGNYDFYESRWAELGVLGRYEPLKKLSVTADYRHVSPDLFLSRNSILAIFTVEEHNEAGGGAQYGPWKRLTFSADYHYLFEDDGHGNRARASATWRCPSGTTAGAELGLQNFYSNPSGSYLGNGYFWARAYGSKKIWRIPATLDLQETAFQQPVNGQNNSFVASATAGYPLGRGFTALVAGSGGVTPYFSRYFDFLAKVSYSESYHRREVH
jgi:hypothetical protein